MSLIIDNTNPSAVVVKGNGEPKIFDSFMEACKYADEVRDKRFPKWPDDQTSFQFLESFDEARIDRIAASHGDGEHYQVGDEWLREYGLTGGAE
ncbi:hypothetical protein HMPREF1487_04358 [Pseudomonas sp. HPB0071]|uniref:hypothetical protein n=1 Tax=unclassified Pseudomonas TaxID=196821 RepID=UPI0002C94FC0|nr:MULTISPECIES: hypothetical protein [unclassified Pseudomonas]ENA37440.1 hypothetical protein HMPREF1487_04358 [Pseudomonas sp. HPB0071]